MLATFWIFLTWRRTVSTLNLLTTFLFTTLFTILSLRRILLTYRIHCLMFLPLDCGGSVFGRCCVMHYLSVISSLQSSWGRESWLLYFNCLPDVLWLLVFCGSSSWCRGLICSEWLCYFLIILIYLLRQYILRRHYATSRFNAWQVVLCSWQVVLCSWQLQVVGATYYMYIFTVFM